MANNGAWQLLIVYRYVHIIRKHTLGFCCRPIKRIWLARVWGIKGLWQTIKWFCHLILFYRLPTKWLFLDESCDKGGDRQFYLTLINISRWQRIRPEMVIDCEFNNCVCAIVSLILINLNVNSSSICRGFGKQGFQCQGMFINVCSSTRLKYTIPRQNGTNKVQNGWKFSKLKFQCSRLVLLFIALKLA